MSRRLFVIAACTFMACGGPLDRVDGRLVIELRDMPASVDRVEVEVRAGDRRFAMTFPPLPTIDAFSAVPVGPSEVDVSLYAGDALVAARLGIMVDIAIDAPQRIELRFGDAPEVFVDAPLEHFVGDGPIAVDIREVQVDRAATLTLRAGGRTVEAPATGLGWSSNVDPLVTGDVVPFDLKFEAEVCYDDTPPSCAIYLAQTRVHREVWTATVAGRPAVAPIRAGDRLVFATDDGIVSIRSLDGRELGRLQLDGPLYAGLAAIGDAAFVVDGNNVLRGIDLASASLRTWSVDLGGTRASDVVTEGARLIVGSGRRLLSIDPLNGTESELAVLPSAIRARPWVDAAGIVAVDVEGHLVRLDNDDVPTLELSLDAGVRAGPVRADGRIWVATLDGWLIPIRETTPEPPLPLGAPVGHPLLAFDDGVVAAAGRQVVFVRGSMPTVVALADPITAAPVRFGTRVAVGTRSGPVFVVSPSGASALSKLEGVALGLLPLVEFSRDLVAAGSTGDITRLSAEASF